MRIWHEDLIPILCRQHLLAVWREGLGCWAILTEDKKGYRNHPAVKEFEGNTIILWDRLAKIHKEMVSRGYHPKRLPIPRGYIGANEYKPWQSLEEQIEVLKHKGCDCDLSTLTD